jgi:hypothetical protein
VQRALRKLERDHIQKELLGANLRLELDRVPLWREPGHVSIKQLAEDFAQYLYLPRLVSPEVLIAAVQHAVHLPTWEADAFAIADGWDEQAQRYQGLRVGNSDGIGMQTILVKPGLAKQQLEREAPPKGEGQAGSAADPSGAMEVRNGGYQPQSGPSTGQSQPPLPRLLKRFHGTVELNAQRVSRDAGQIAQEILQHLVGQVGAEVNVSVEIHAHLPEGAADHIVRTVTENARTLGFRDFGFEEE